MAINPNHPDAALVLALLARDEAAFRDLVTRHHHALVTIARHYVSTQAVAEEVAQETWLAVIRSLPSFEGRSSLKSWIFAILTNLGRSRGVRESRVLPLSSVALETTDDDESPCPQERFLEASQRWGGHWSNAPRRLRDLPEELLESNETLAVIDAAIAALPGSQQRVMWLRDVKGWTSEEVCAVLDLTMANQRVLLHRARAKVRAAVEVHLSS